MKTPAWWQTRSLTAQILLPISAMWQFCAWLRPRLATPVKLSVPVICVGNVVAGGGGKTPVALALGEATKALGINAYFISRGYGGSIRLPTRVDIARHTASEVGDEPLLLAHVLPTIIARDRVQAAKLAVEQGATLIIMDDGLQYPHMIKDFSILVMKGENPIGNGLLMPAGPLREPLASALKRSDVIIHIDGNNVPLPQVILQSRKSVFKSKSQTVVPESINKAIAFAGIAHPVHFHQSLIRAGVEVLEFYDYPDHHPYTQHEINRLVEHAKALSVPLITTEKDLVRLRSLDLGNHKVHAAKQQLKFENGDVFFDILKQFKS
jgi:tetraacyldisaccharide 4'-kinase